VRLEEPQVREIRGPVGAIGHHLIDGQRDRADPFGLALISGLVGLYAALSVMVEVDPMDVRAAAEAEKGSSAPCAITPSCSSLSSPVCDIISSSV
jgi:hypothetical protein